MLSHAPTANCQWTQTFWPWDVNCFGSIGSELFAGSNEPFGPKRSLIVSTDTGATWIAAHTPSMGVVNALISQATFIYAGSDSGLFRSSDSGRTWAQILSYPLLENITALAKSDSILFAGDLRSTDNGVHWIQSGAAPYMVSLCWKSPYLFAGTEGRGIYRSSDSGLTWTAMNTGVTLQPYPNASVFYSIAIIGDNLFTVDAVGPCYRSTNNGESWTPTTATASAGWGNSHLITSGNFLFAARNGGGGGPFLSTDLGSSWQDVGSPPRTNSIYVFGGYLFTGTNATGVFRRPLTDFGVMGVEPAAQPITAIELYPNPTNGIVTVRGVRANTVRVLIANVLGATVMELAKPYTSDFTLDLSHLTRGMYLARFATASSVETRLIVRE